ncbi:MAG: OmpH family outer membrane protein [Planctomycetes bacterium]|nr:OmpH family outer membrane protein [Planctomycetota bacterium]
MKAKLVVLGCLISIVVLFMGYEAGEAKSKSSGGLQIGVVNIRKIFQESKTHLRYREETKAEQERLIAELSKLGAEIEVERAGLSALKPNSSDYMEQMKTMFEKQANLRAKEEFYKQHLELKDQQWTEQLYQSVLKEVGVVAKKKGLDLVLADDEVEFPTASPNELMLTIRTNTLLYSEGCLDITSDVIARLDAKGKKK